MRRLPLDFRDQYFGCEIELTGINRATAAQTLADLFGTRAEHSGGGYDAYRVKDLDGKEWKIVRDSSIHPECRRRSVLIGETYKVELNSPKLEYGEMDEIMMINTEGIVIRMMCSDISVLGRVTSGVKLMNLSENVSVASIAKVRETSADSEDIIKKIEDEMIEDEKNDEEIKNEETTQE